MVFALFQPVIAEPTCRVLIADDDPSIRALLAVALRRRRTIGIAEAANGMEAIECLQRDRWCVLVLDLMMPTMSGWDVIDWLTKHRDRAPRSVVVVSAADRTILKELDPRAVNAIIFKPFDVFQVAAYVRSVCELHTNDRRHRRIVGETTAAG